MAISTYLIYSGQSLYLVRPWLRNWALRGEWTRHILDLTGSRGRLNAWACPRGERVGKVLLPFVFAAKACHVLNCHEKAILSLLSWHLDLFFNMIRSLDWAHLRLGGTEAEKQFISGQFGLFLENWLLLDCTGWPMSDLRNCWAIWYFAS